MQTATFAEYASSPDLTADEVYTVELLIERVRSNFDPNYWDDWSERGDARSARDYQPAFSFDHIQPAAAELKDLSWLSFQRLPSTQRPVRDLTALRYLPNISGLVLIDNEVSDLTPLQTCTNLRRLHLERNPIRNLAPLAGCVNLEELHLGDTPIESFSVLEALPRLRELSIAVDQLPAFRRINCLPALQELKFGLGNFHSFDGFPKLPELRSICGAHVKSLSGLQRFAKLENLVNLFGEFDTLEPLRELKGLTHANILSSRVRSLEPLRGLTELRDLKVIADVVTLDLSPLESLPALHEAAIKCAGQEPASLEKLRAKLSSWDVEFRSEAPRHTPSLELEVVDQDTFDFYDSKQPFNLGDSHTNRGLLSSELDWLDAQLEKVFAVSFDKDEDYTIPFQWRGARSRTVVVYSQRAVEAFPRLVLGMQNVLCGSNRDWIIYFQSDGVEPEFIVWVYPQKVVTTEKYATVVRNLIEID
jgi:hypothetical protein